ncbi:MAG: IPT/TIG domain-containing protein, partial [Candidatus Obscuribacterales bacterium]|nr:IPT/TIG domain-containing protein [Candidatus Obscuribacterales bacterium]
VEAGGIPGSTMSWKLLAARVAPTLTAGKPNKAGAGDTITLTGTHFGSKTSAITVKFGGTNAEVKSASETSLDIVVPSNAKAGDNKVTVTTGGATSNSIIIAVIGVPELESLSLESGPPGQELTISGRNFSQKAAENTVTIAGATAEVTGASPSSLTVIIPEVYNPQYAVPVTVEVNGVKAKNSINMDIFNRVY